MPVFRSESAKSTVLGGPPAGFLIQRAAKLAVPLLPSAFCLLPSAFCLLPSAFYLLPSAVSVFLPMSRLRIAILFHRIGPYHFARLRAAGRIIPTVAIESSGVDATYAWDAVNGTNDFERVTLFGDADAQKLPKAEVVRHTALTLDKIAPAVVVIPGWADVAALGALHWCLKNQVPAVFMSETTAWDEPRRAFREFVKRRIVALGSAALVGGTPQADYIHELGVPKDRIFLGYDAVDNGYFAAEAAKYRCPLSVDCCPSYFLTSNRFIAKKNLLRLLDAYAAYLKSCQLSVISDCGGEPGRSAQAPQTTDNGQQTTLPWPLVMLGDGELKEQLLAHCKKLGLRVIESAPWEAEENTESRKQKAVSKERGSSPTPDSRLPTPDSRLPVPSPLSPGTVFFPGFRQYDELPRFYANAGAFVHASTTEQWGLVVNEAMASGLPVLVSNRCGCARDLVKDGINGFSFDPYNVEQLAQLMLKISACHFPQAMFGDASRAIINEWGPQRFASGLQAAVNKALEVGPKRARLLDKSTLRALIAR